MVKWQKKIDDIAWSKYLLKCKIWHGFAMPFTFTPPLRLWHSTMSPNLVWVANQLLQLKTIHTGPNASKVSPDDSAGLDPVVCIAHCAWVMLLWTGVWLVNGAIGKSNRHLLQKRPSTTQLAIFCYGRGGPAPAILEWYGHCACLSVNVLWGPGGMLPLENFFN